MYPDMLLTAYFTFLISILDIFLAIFPAVVIPVGIESAIFEFFKALHFADLILPMAELQQALVWYLTIETLFFVLAIQTWIYNKIRGSG